MLKKFFIALTGIVVGVFLGIYLLFNTSLFSFGTKNSSSILINPLSPKKTVIGFLPYWLLSKASDSYSKHITTLAYFSLRVDGNGNIQKLLTPQQEEPGWHALRSDKLTPFFDNALKNKVILSLTVASGDSDSIGMLVSDPIIHAKNLISDIKPIMQKYKFSDLNIDIEYTGIASSSARSHFSQFIKEVRKQLDSNNTLTVEISPTDAIKNNLLDPMAIGKVADNVVLMAYDYHSTSSFVTGPVAPISGAGVTSEYDVTSAVEKTLDDVPAIKLILGIPLYGYGWESLSKTPRSAIIPGTGMAVSNKTAEELLLSCPTCSVKLDKEANEKYISSFDANFNDYKTIFYPDSVSTQAKINLANKLELNGLALWALGYEGNSILNPLGNYIGK
jgi:spore germination protein YaaH